MRFGGRRELGWRGDEEWRCWERGYGGLLVERVAALGRTKYVGHSEDTPSRECEI